MSKRSLLLRAAGALVRGAATLTEEVAGLVLGSDPVAARYARERRRGKRTYETAPPLRVRADMQAQFFCAYMLTFLYVFYDFFSVIRAQIAIASFIFHK